MRLMTIVALVCAAGAMQAGTAAPVYDVSFVLPQASYTGTTTFVVSRAGEVAGTMKLMQPVNVDATLAGAVKDGTWTFEYPYTIAEQGCSGTVRGTATVSADRATVKGAATILGACVEEPIESTFTFTRQAKK